MLVHSCAQAHKTSEKQGILPDNGTNTVTMNAMAKAAFLVGKKKN